jgi:hypothetical protein
MEDHSNGIDVECSRSILANCVLSQFSKSYLMYSATYAKDNVEDGVVESPPSCSAGQLPVYLPSPLQRCRLTPVQQRSCSPTQQNIRIPQRQLYCKASLCNMEEAKEKDSFNYSNSVSIEPQIVHRASQSHVGVRLRDLDKELCLLWIWSLSCHPYPRLLFGELLSTGRNAYAAKC